MCTTDKIIGKLCLKTIKEKGQASPYMVGATNKMKGCDTFLVKWGYMGYNSGS